MKRKVFTEHVIRVLLKKIESEGLSAHDAFRRYGIPPWVIALGRARNTNRQLRRENAQLRRVISVMRQISTN